MPSPSSTMPTLTGPSYDFRRVASGASTPAGMRVVSGFSGGCTVAGAVTSATADGQVNLSSYVQRDVLSLSDPAGCAGRRRG